MWRQDKLARRSLTPPAAFGAHVAVGDFEGYIHLLDRDDGRLAARERVDGDGLASAPVAVGDVLLVYGRGGTLTALRAESPSTAAAWAFSSFIFQLPSAILRRISESVSPPVNGRVPVSASYSMTPRAYKSLAD